MIGEDEYLVPFPALGLRAGPALPTPSTLQCTRGLDSESEAYRSPFSFFFSPSPFPPVPGGVGLPSPLHAIRPANSGETTMSPMPPLSMLNK